MNKAKKKLLLNLIISILIILFTQTSNLSNSIKLTTLFLSLGSIIGAIWNFLSSIDYKNMDNDKKE